LGKPILLGAGLFTAYDWLRWYFVHHQEGAGRPGFYDHMAASFILQTIGAFYYLSHPMPIIAAMVFSITIWSPTSWWLRSIMSLNQGKRHSNIFYENDVTPDEVERFRNQDHIESLAWMMQTDQGAGYTQWTDQTSQ
jgi:hypothetical protein